MADQDKDQKTHDPTHKRIEDARKRGDTPSAPEMRHAAIFVAILVALGGVGIHTFALLAGTLTSIWSHAEDVTLTGTGTQSMMTGLFGRLAVVLSPVFAATIALALVGGMVQGLPTLSWSRVAPKWNKLSPMAGAKRLFGKDAFVEFLKTLAKLAVVMAIAIWTIWPHAVGIAATVGADPAQIVRATGAMVVALVKAVAMPVAAIAGFDFVYQRRKWFSKLKMSLQEIKDEHKDSEGDPKIKAKIKAIAMQRSRRRMMAAVPGASVVITNPTHYAIALRYEHGQMGAPVVVAKGVDAVALKIRALATESGVPIVENRPLARALHASVEIDHPIPIEHYAAVAEIIGYVMRLAKGRA